MPRILDRQRRAEEDARLQVRQRLEEEALRKERERLAYLEAETRTREARAREEAEELERRRKAASRLALRRGLSIGDLAALTESQQHPRVEHPAPKANGNTIRDERAQVDARDRRDADHHRDH